MSTAKTCATCATCGATGPTNDDTSGIERSKVHRALVDCGACGKSYCSSPCFSMHGVPAAKHKASA